MGGGHCDCQENKARLTTLLASRSNLKCLIELVNFSLASKAPISVQDRPIMVLRNPNTDY